MDGPRATIAVSFARPADARLVREHLRAHGHRVVEMAAAAAGGIDLVLLDIPSLHRHTTAFLRRLKDNDPVFLPVILAMDQRGDAAGWLNTGMIDDCLRLPLSKAELVSRINVFLRLRQRTGALAEKSEEIRALV
ncbi:MAG TPA: response regulator transcription factor, partial [Desulfobulbus sp.]|nr:response regulator transcription factor [Desulfobulbus sp.]